MTRQIAVVCVCLMLGSMGCSKKSETAPTPVTPKPACETNNTAKVQYQNRSNISATYDIFIDGGKAATIAPAADSAIFDVAAGVQHTILFRYTNTTNSACAPFTPALAQCSSTAFSCAF